MPTPGVDIKVAVQGAQKSASELALVSAALKATIAGIAASASVQFLRNAYEEATKAAVAQAQLQQALLSTGQASKSVSEAFARQADVLQRLTGYEDEVVTDAQRLLISFGATAQQVERLTPLVADLAAGLGTDLTNAARLVGQAIDGESVSLGRLNITASNVNDVIEQLERHFGGQAEAIKSARGPASDLGSAFSQLYENAGNVFKQEIDFTLGLIASAAYKAADGVKVLAEAMQSARTATAYYANQSSQALLHLQLMAGLVGQAEFVERMVALQQAQQQILSPPTNNANNNAQKKKEDPKPELTFGPDSSPFFEERQNTLSLALRSRELQIRKLEGAIGAQAQRDRERAYEAELKILDKKREVLNTTQKMIPLNEYQTQLLQIQEERLRVQSDLERSKVEYAERLKELDLETSFTANINNSLDQTIERIGSAAQQVGRAFSSIQSSSIDGIADGINGLLNQTLSWGQALQKIQSGIFNGITQAISRMFAEWIVGRTAVFLKELFFSGQETAAKTPSALLTSITSYGTAAVVGVAALTAALAAFGGFADGGYTGYGGKYDVAGAVHRGEVVFSQRDVAELGLANIEAFRRSYRSGYASGGVVGLASPSVSVAPAGVTVVVINDRSELKRLIESRSGRLSIIDAASGARLDIGVPT